MEVHIFDVHAFTNDIMLQRNRSFTPPCPVRETEGSPSINAAAVNASEDTDEALAASGGDSLHQPATAAATAATAATQPGDGVGEEILGTYTPHYIFHPLVPFRISRLAPKRVKEQMKFVVFLRDPVKRAISSFWCAYRAAPLAAALSPL